MSGDESWDEARQLRTDDLLVYLALANFRRRPRFKRLPIDLQRDLRAFFGNYTKACRQGDELLFRTGDADEIDAACRRSVVGHLQPNALWVHGSAVAELEPLLRVYEGCARAYLGEVEDANIVKLHRFSGKVSYLACPEFETTPHPPLVNCLKLSLRSRQVRWDDFAEDGDPVVLHFKEQFVTSDHSSRKKFERLSKQEQKWGVVDGTCPFRRRTDWESILTMYSARLQGHRLARI